MNASQQRQRHADGGVRDLFGPVVRHVRHMDAARPGRHMIHVVESHPAANNESAILQPFNRPRANLGAMINHDGVGVLDSAHEVVLGRRIQRHHIGQVAQDPALVIEWLGDEIGDNNFRALGHG